MNINEYFIYVNIYNYIDIDIIFILLYVLKFSYR